MWKNWLVASHVVAVALVGCASEKGTGPSAPTEPQVIVSAPIPRASLPGGAGSSGSVVFVSATPQSVPGAVQAIVRGGDGQSEAVPMHDGGFDPVAVTGEDGDRVEVVVTDSAGNKTTVTGTAKQGVRPRVVRTIPAPRKTDVPLNIRMTVVFTAPVDSASVAAGVTLLKEGVEVAGTVRLTTDAFAVEFIPAQPLDANTDYILHVGEGVRDVLGQALAQPVSVEFRTGGTEGVPPPPLGSVSLVPDPDPLMVAVGAPEVTSTIAINRTASFAGPVELTVPEYPLMPTGVMATVSPRIATGNTSTISISAVAGAVNGTYPLQIIGRGTGIADVYAVVWFTITGGSRAFFTFDPATITVTANGPSATAVLARDTTTRLLGRLWLSVSEPPPGFTVSVPMIMSLPTAMLTVQAGAGVAPGTYFVIVSGHVAFGGDATANGPYWRAMLTVVVQAAPTMRRKGNGEIGR